MKSKSKILIISHNSFSKTHNNGKTLESFLSSFEKENLAQLFFSQNEIPDTDFCQNYYQITDLTVLNSVLKLHSTHRLFNIAKNYSENLVLFRDMLWKTRAWDTKELRNWCQEFNPNAIFYVGGNLGFSHIIARHISKMLNKPLITYFTDDYLISPKKRNLLDIIQRWRMQRFYKRTVEQSSLLFTIGELMSTEYTKYFGKDFFPIMNSVPVKPYVPYTPNEQINISYFGGLHLDRWKMIVKLGQILKNTNVIINVYAINPPTDEIASHFKRSRILYKGGVSGNELQEAMLKSDILLHVESDDNYYKSLTKLSVSTKIPEYIMSGRLVVGYGPKEVASMRILSDNNIGIVISSSLTDKELKSELLSIINNSELRKETGLRGYRFAIENFNNSDIVNRFTQKIEQVINMHQ